jgi:serine/threonine-protein kinase
MLVDFGLAAADRQMTDDALANSPNPRTIDYAGLERATGVRKDDPRSDIYFLGCIYYHMLTGKPPLYETKDRIQRLSKTRFMEIEPIAKLDPTLPRHITAIVNRAMELNVDERYQTPADMLADFKVVLQAPDGAFAAPAEEDAPARPTAPTAEPPRHTLMFIESNIQLQDVLRERLKNKGYRVLVTRDPDRALSRFADGSKAADCVIFSTSELGEPALEAFNKFAEGRNTSPIPAVLLLGEHQQDWRKRAKLNKHRVVMSMPIKLRQLREVLDKLVPNGPARDGHNDG